MKELAEAIATFFRVGYLRPAPGTWGSLTALPVAWAIHQGGGFALLAFATVLAFVGGLWATRIMIAGSDNHDPSEIVIDEVAGQWLALWPVSFGAQMMGADILALWPGWIAAFLGFRLFDIWKPWLVGRADARGDAMGVMLDDIWAGAFAAVVTIILAGLAHGIMMA